MPKRYFVLFRTIHFIACALLVGRLMAGGPYQGPMGAQAIPLELAEEGAPENARLISSSLAVLLGPFGAHRIYLGTSPEVAVIYGLTFGGFGILVLLDLGHVLFSKDLEPYRNNNKVFMWGNPSEELTPR